MEIIDVCQHRTKHKKTHTHTVWEKKLRFLMLRQVVNAVTTVLKMRDKKNTHYCNRFRPKRKHEEMEPFV